MRRVKRSSRLEQLELRAHMLASTGVYIPRGSLRFREASSSIGGLRQVESNELRVLVLAASVRVAIPFSTSFFSLLLHGAVSFLMSFSSAIPASRCASLIWLVT